MIRESKENLADFEFEEIPIETMKNKVERIKKFKRKYKNGKISKYEIDEAHRFLNEGAERYIDIDLMTEENIKMIENGIENITVASFLCSRFDGLILSDDDIFIYLSIKTDYEGNIEEITEKYLFSAELINEAIEYSKSEKKYYEEKGC